MKDRPACVIPRISRTLGLASAVGALLSASLPGIQFSTGELRGSFDSTFSIGGLYRLDDPDPQFYGVTNTFDGIPGKQTSVNVDDGNLNYGQGWVSTLFKGSHDLELRYGNPRFTAS